MSVTIRQLFRHIYNVRPTSISIPEMLKVRQRNIRIHLRTFSLSLATQNMGLLVSPAPYLGTDRDGAVSEIIARIREVSADIFGLCEVFSDGERETIRTGVQDIYPYFEEGPDEQDLDSDGGLLLLSKHPIIQSHHLIYRDCAGDDCWANKGVIHVRVHPLNSTMPFDVFYSHTQNIEEDGGEQALYAQISKINQLVQEYADPNLPIFIMGDLNMPGTVPAHYNQLITRLSNPVDCWLVPGNAFNSGYTFTSYNNFYEDDDDNPHQNHRLDFILMKAGLKYIPILYGFEILKFTHGTRFISDHFGVCARFEQLVEVYF